MSVLYELFGGSRGLANLLSNALGTEAELLIAESAPSNSGVVAPTRRVEPIAILPGTIVREVGDSSSRRGLRRRTSDFSCAIAASQLASAPRAGLDQLRFAGDVYRVERVVASRLADGAIVYRLECERS